MEASEMESKHNDTNWRTVAIRLAAIIQLAIEELHDLDYHAIANELMNNSDMNGQWVAFNQTDIGTVLGTLETAHTPDLAMLDFVWNRQEPDDDMTEEEFPF
jgi:hypothetical protein